MPIKETNSSSLNATPSYYTEKIKKRKEQELQQSAYLRSLFNKANEFYKKNYPKSFQEPPLEWKEPKQKFTLDDEAIFVEEIKDLPTNIKLLMRYILQYSLKERNYKKIDTYRKYKELRGRLKNLIPGGKVLDKIERIEEEKRKKEEELSQLYKEYNKITKSEKPADKKHICTKCGKEFGNAGGLGSHMRTCNGGGTK